MCLSIPAKITEITQKDSLLMGTVDFGGVAREVCLDYVPEAKVGEYCIIHVGFAISLLSESEAQETLALLDEIAAMDESLPPSPASPITSNQ